MEKKPLSKVVFIIMLYVSVNYLHDLYFILFEVWRNGWNFLPIGTYYIIVPIGIHLYRSDIL